jgi:hypothetical protein
MPRAGCSELSDVQPDIGIAMLLRVWRAFAMLGFADCETWSFGCGGVPARSVTLDVAARTLNRS